MFAWFARRNAGPPWSRLSCFATLADHQRVRPRVLFMWMIHILLRGYMCICSLASTHHWLIVILGMWTREVIWLTCTLFPFAVLDNNVSELFVMPFKRFSFHHPILLIRGLGSRSIHWLILLSSVWWHQRRRELFICFPQLSTQVNQRPPSMVMCKRKLFNLWAWILCKR